MIDTKYTVPSSHFHMKLSAWDCCFPPMYSKRLLLFSLPEGASDARKEEILTGLYSALRATIAEIPWLAGVVTPVKERLGSYEILPGGEACLDVKDYYATIDFAGLEAAGFPCSALDAQDLCPLPEAVYPMATQAFCMRASFIKGGLILAFQISHIACDGSAIMMIMNRFADFYCQAQKEGGKAREAKSTVTPAGQQNLEASLDRGAIITGGGVHGSIERHPAFTTKPLSFPRGSGPPPVCACYRIDATNLRLLKDTVSPTDPATGRRSTQDALAALIWRALMRARHRAGVIAADREVHMCTAIDGRAMLGLPKPYYGNAIYAVNFKIPLRRLINGGGGDEAKDVSAENRPELLGDVSAEERAGLAGLRMAARAFRDAVGSVDAVAFRDLLDFVERTAGQGTPTRLAGTEDFRESTMLFISWFRFKAHELWFGDAPAAGGTGLGRLAAYKIASNYTISGGPSALPRLPAEGEGEGAEGGGACDFVMAEPQEIIDEVGRDELFTRFVKRTS